MALEHAGHLADGLADLVDHRVPRAPAGRIARSCALADLERVRGAEKIDEAAGLHAQGARVAGGVALQVAQQLHHGHGAAARGRHRAVAADDVVAVDHLAVVVGRDGDAAADVAHDEAAVLIAAAERRGVADGRLLEVERVQVHAAVHALHAGHAREVAELVGVGRVDHEGGLAAGRLRKLVGELRAELRGVLDAVGAVVGVAQHDLVHRVGAARRGEQAAAAPDEGVDAREVDAVGVEHLADGVAAVGHLLGDAAELRELVGGVRDVLGEDLGLPVEQAHLGGGGAGVDHEHAIVLLGHASPPAPGRARSSSRRCPRSRRRGRSGCSRTRSS